MTHLHNHADVVGELALRHQLGAGDLAVDGGHHSAAVAQVGLAPVVAQAHGALVLVGGEGDAHRGRVALADLVGAVLGGVAAEVAAVDLGGQRLLHGGDAALQIRLVRGCGEHQGRGVGDLGLGAVLEPGEPHLRALPAQARVHRRRRGALPAEVAPGPLLHARGPARGVEGRHRPVVVADGQGLSLVALPVEAQRGPPRAGEQDPPGGQLLAEGPAQAGPGHAELRVPHSHTAVAGVAVDLRPDRFHGAVAHRVDGLQGPAHVEVALRVDPHVLAAVAVAAAVLVEQVEGDPHAEAHRALLQEVELRRRVVLLAHEPGGAVGAGLQAQARPQAHEVRGGLARGRGPGDFPGVAGHVQDAAAVAGEMDGRRTDAAEPMGAQVGEGAVSHGGALPIRSLHSIQKE